MEIATSIGFPTWSDSKDPCFLCKCCSRDWKHKANVSAVTWPWPLKRHAEYAAAASACEVNVHLESRADFVQIRGSLEYERSSA
eukprot:1108336-Alexandrium_andersonii.AAC.1